MYALAIASPIPAPSTFPDLHAIIQIRGWHFVALLKWTGSHRPSLGKPEATPEVESILKRLGVEGSMWIDLVWKFKKYYQGSAAGLPETLAQHAQEHQHRWRRGQRAVRGIFGAGEKAVSVG